MPPLSRNLRRRIVPALLALLHQEPASPVRNHGNVFFSAALGNQRRTARPALRDSLLLPCLGAAAHIFGAVSSLRRWLYQQGILPQTRLPVLVISVGNIAVGGTGKTPMVEYLARALQGLGRNPLVLTRGYAGGDEARMLQHQLGPDVIVGVGTNRADVARQTLQRVGYGTSFSKNDLGCQSPGACRLDGYGRGETCDDELLGTGHTLGKRAGAHGGPKGGQPVTPGSGHGNDADAVLSSQDPMHEFPSRSDPIGAIILDDGMQHLAMARDLEIVMVNALDPFGNGRLLPRGTLREPLTSLLRASAVVLHHADMVPASELQQLIQQITSAAEDSANPQGPPLFLSMLSPLRLSRLNGLQRASQDGHAQPNMCLPRGLKQETQAGVPGELALDALKGVPVVCLSGIGCPRAFEATVTRKVVHHLALADHEEVQHEDVDALNQVWSAFEDRPHLKPKHVILTEKDLYRQPKALKSLLEPFGPIVVSSRLEILDGCSLSECCMRRLLLKGTNERVPHDR